MAVTFFIKTSVVDPYDPDPIDPPPTTVTGTTPTTITGTTFDLTPFSMKATEDQYGYKHIVFFERAWGGGDARVLYTYGRGSQDDAEEDGIFPRPLWDPDRAAESDNAWSGTYWYHTDSNSIHYIQFRPYPWDGGFTGPSWAEPDEIYILSVKIDTNYPGTTLFGYIRDGNNDTQHSGSFTSNTSISVTMSGIGYIGIRNYGGNLHINKIWLETADGWYDYTYYDRSANTGDGGYTYAGWLPYVEIDNLTQPGGGSIRGIGVDSDDIVHIAYDDYYNNIYYTTNTSGTISFDIPTKIWDSGSGDVGYAYGDLVLDSNGKPHIFFSVVKDVYHGTNAGGSWAFESLGTMANAPLISAAIKSDNTLVVLVSYLDGYPTTTMKVYEGTWGSWSSSTITPPYDYITGLPDVVVRSTDVIDITYSTWDEDENDIDIHWATDFVGSFQNTTIATAQDRLYYHELTRDYLNRLHLMLWNGDGGDPEYWTNVGGSWAGAEISWRGTGAYDPKAWYHGGDYAEIVYYHYSDGDIPAGIDYTQEELPT